GCVASICVQAVDDLPAVVDHCAHRGPADLEVLSRISDNMGVDGRAVVSHDLAASSAYCCVESSRVGFSRRVVIQNGLQAPADHCSERLGAITERLLAGSAHKRAACGAAGVHLLPAIADDGPEADPTRLNIKVTLIGDACTADDAALRDVD